MFILSEFISNSITHRQHSMFFNDIEQHRSEISVGIADKSVLVIGGAGSIGSSFIRALLPYKPRTLVVVDINENALAELTRDLRSTADMFVPADYVTYPFDYSSSVFKRMFVSRGGFDIVANFSAHKHVRSEKDVFSIEALLNNNVIHASKLLKLLSEYKPETYFCVSTDKAANPVNIMGASKRIMEDLIFSYSDEFSVKTARFANVAFSNGSLLDGFLHRFSSLQPFSAPSDVKRYFVSSEESGQICLLACILGENREIFFPKLEEQQMEMFDKIARRFLKNHGFNIIECGSDEEAVEKAKQLKQGSNLYPVHFSISDTSGEKSVEEFYTDSEMVELDRFVSLGVIVNKKLPKKNDVENFIKCLERLFKEEQLEKDDIVKTISNYLPEFHHMETGKSLDGKM